MVARTEGQDAQSRMEVKFKVGNAEGDSHPYHVGEVWERVACGSLTFLPACHTLFHPLYQYYWPSTQALEV